jgi:hypothetical protein
MARAPTWLALWAILAAMMARVAESGAYIADVGGMGNTSLSLSRGQYHYAYAFGDAWTSYYVYLGKYPTYSSGMSYYDNYYITCVTSGG